MTSEIVKDAHLCTQHSLLLDAVPGDNEGNTGTEVRGVSEKSNLTGRLVQHRPV